MKTMTSALRRKIFSAHSWKVILKEWLIGRGVFLFFLLTGSLRAQVDCTMPAGSPGADDRSAGCNGNDPTFNTGGIYDSKYSRQDFWIPNSTTPEITIPVAIHIFQDNLGQGTFTDVPATHATLAQVMAWANQMFQDGGTSSDPQPWQTHTTDCKVNFVLDDRIYFYAGSGLETYCPPGSGGAGLVARMNYVAGLYPERMKYLGIYSTLPGTCGQYARMPYPNWHWEQCWAASDMDGYNGVHVNLGINEWNQFANAVTIAHELAHCIDLDHLYATSNSCEEACDVTHREYLPDIFGPTPPSACWFNSCSGGPDPWAPGNSVTNNIMNGCGLAWPNLYWISDLQAGRFHRALAVKSVKDYAEDVCGTTPLAVTQDETWDFEMRLYQDLVVETGATLTLKCILEMPNAGKIIVKPGARLIIDGGKVTTARYSSSFWPGIEVWGDNTHNQSGSPIPTYQGMVVIKNGGTIEHAREAINVLQGGVWGTFGGVVQCTDAHFINCRRSAQFLKYQNATSGGIPIGNRSFFTRCEFVVDDDYRGIDDFYAHVSMWYVDGINFRACNFKNLQTGIAESSKLGMGIISLDAKYTVTGKCNIILPCCIDCPEANWTKGTFVGLDHGIHALNGVTDRAFTVDRCRFENNICGVYANGMTNFSVTRNEFEFGERPSVVVLDGDQDQNFAGNHRGVFSFMSSGFRIEQNNFSRDPDANFDCDGIVVNQTMEHNDLVYKNTASSMDHAYIGEAQCIDLTAASSIGLQFLCNLNNGNGSDFWERQVPDQLPLWPHSIRTQQGSAGQAAGNTFDQETFTPDASDYRNSTDWVLNYWHNGGTGEPLDVTLGWVGTTTTVNGNQCASHFNNGGGHVLGLVKKGELEQEFETEKTAYISTAYAFNSLLDGGNTDAVIQEVVESWPQDAWELHDYLMQKSPYLSVEVLKEMMTRNILPLPMVLEICLANPEATKQEGFVKWAQFEAPNPLPQYMIDLIAGSWEERTFRMELEASMGQHHADMSLAAHMLLVDMKNDTITEPTDSLKARWAQLPNFGARMAEAMTLAQTLDFDGAMDILNEAKENYPMKGEREPEIDRAIAYFDLLKTAHAAGRDETRLTAGEVDALAMLAADSYDRPSTWIWNVLCFGYGHCRPTPSGGEQPTQRVMHPAKPDEAAPVKILTLVPNPADVAVTFRYEAKGADGNLAIIIRDASSREVQRIPLQNKQGQWLWDTRQVAPGAYTVDLLSGDRRLATEQLLIKR